MHNILPLYKCSKFNIGVNQNWNKEILNVLANVSISYFLFYLARYGTAQM